MYLLLASATISAEVIGSVSSLIGTGIWVPAGEAPASSSTVSAPNASNRTASARSSIFTGCGSIFGAGCRDADGCRGGEGRRGGGGADFKSGKGDTGGFGLDWTNSSVSSRDPRLNMRPPKMSASGRNMPPPRPGRSRPSKTPNPLRTTKASQIEPRTERTMPAHDLLALVPMFPFNHQGRVIATRRRQPARPSSTAA